MEKKTWIILGVIVLVFGGLIGISAIQANSGKSPKDDSSYSVDEYDLGTVIEDTSNSGGIPEMISGNPDAPIKIFEYGDYQCTACAPMNPQVNKLIEEYDGKVAVVFRTMVMSYHQNGRAAASAALAAYKQGY